MKCYGYVYKITNKINGKIYFGITEDSFQIRYKGNIEKNTHNVHLKRAIEKYGIENFDINEKFDIAYNEDELWDLEDMYICIYNTLDSRYGYNKRRSGSKHKGNGKLSEESKEKISESNTGKTHTEETKKLWSEQRRGEGNGMYGKHHTEETKDKIKEARAKQENPMLGKRHTEDTKAKIAQKHSKRVRCNTGEEFDSAELASKWCNLKCSTSLCKSCKDKNKSAGRHPITGEKLYWEYIN